jgi:hypothetical protein
MMRETTLADILEACDRLPLEDQENLMNILQHRIREQRRAERVKDVQEAQKEFAEGKCQPVTPEQLMEEILS